MSKIEIQQIYKLYFEKKGVNLKKLTILTKNVIKLIYIAILTNSGRG
jgi:hypothetical protein